MPEIDLPSHVASWSGAYPHIVLNCNRHAAQDADVFKARDKDTLDPTLDQTYQVIGWVLDDVVDYFPDNYLHLGGDEVDLRCFNADVMARARQKHGAGTSKRQLLQLFWDRVIQMVHTHTLLCALLLCTLLLCTLL